jgi:SecD/SecF fusion protein
MRQSKWLMISIGAIALSTRVSSQGPPVVETASQVQPYAFAAERKLLDSGKSAADLVLRPPAAYLRSAQWNSQKLRQTSEVVGRRLRDIGVEPPSVTVDNAVNTLTVGIPAGKSAEYLARLLTRPVVLEFRYVRELDSEWHSQPAVVHGHETWFETLLGADGRPVSARTLAKVFARPPAFTGADLMPNCRAEQLPRDVVLHFEFKEGQKRRFEASTKSHVGKRLALLLDHHLITAPTINDAIPGKGVIEGRFSLEEARILAIQLNSGALPVPLEVVRRTQDR